MMHSSPDANTGLNHYLDSQFGKEAERRAEAYEAAKAVDIQDLAEQIMADPSKDYALFDWFVETVDPSLLRAEANARPNSMIGMAYSLAALAMAKNKWEWENGK